MLLNTELGMYCNDEISIAREYISPAFNFTSVKGPKSSSGLIIPLQVSMLLIKNLVHSQCGRIYSTAGHAYIASLNSKMPSIRKFIFGI